MNKKELPLELIYEHGFLDNGFRLEYPEGTVITVMGVDPLDYLVHHFQKYGINPEEMEFFIRIPIHE